MWNKLICEMQAAQLLVLALKNKTVATVHL